MEILIVYSYGQAVRNSLLSQAKKMVNKRTANEAWDKFTEAMRQIVKVPHSEIKAHLDAEKEAKKLKRTRKSRYAAFRAVNKNG